MLSSQLPGSSSSKFMEFLLGHVFRTSTSYYSIQTEWGPYTDFWRLFFFVEPTFLELCSLMLGDSDSKFWPLPPQLSKTVFSVGVPLSCFMVKTVPLGRGPEWLQGSPHLFLFYQRSQTCTTYCPLSKTTTSYILCSFFFFFLR